MTKEPTAQLHEAAMQILYGPNCPFEPSDRLPCTAVKLAKAMAEQGVSDRETVEELRRNNQAWQTDLQAMHQVLVATEKALSSVNFGANTPTWILEAISNARTFISSPHRVTVCGGAK